MSYALIGGLVCVAAVIAIIVAVLAVLAVAVIVLVARRRRELASSPPPPRGGPLTRSSPATLGQGQLVVREGASAGKAIPLNRPLTRVGRSRPYSDAVVDDAYVSNPHFSIEREGGVYYIVDEASTNGTRLDGVALRPHQRVPIEQNASIEAGQTRLEFVSATGRGSRGRRGRRGVADSANPYETTMLDDGTP